jgi:hypothetical protein
MLKTLALAKRFTPSGLVKASAKPAVTPRKFVRAGLANSQRPASLRLFNVPSISLRYPIVTKDNVDPEVMKPMPPTEDDVLKEEIMAEEKHLLEHDLEEDDFEDRDDDDLLPEEYVNHVTGEIGGPKGPEPTRYGDWSKNGRVSDF